MMRLKPLSAAVLAVCMVPLTPAVAGIGSGDVTLIHTGDIHGHLVPRPNLRSDAKGRSLEGGVARMYTKIEEIRAASPNSLLINTGDTLQGSGEALFSEGQAMIDVLNLFGFDAHAPGNWDFLYGTARFEQTFVGTGGNPPLANWGALSSNLYNTTLPDPNVMCAATIGGKKYQRVLPPYAIKQVGKVKVGILGVTTARAIAAVGTTVTRNYAFTDAKTEVPCLVDQLRNVEKVDVVVMISELEMARDIQIAETLSPAPDVILNSDMHERTTAPIVVKHPDGSQTLIVEEGQDGTVVGQLKLQIKNGKVTKWHFNQHVITDDYAEEPVIAAKVAEVRAPYVMGTFVPDQTVTVGGNETMLMRPVDEVIATTLVDLHRSNFVDEDMPGVVEGSSHDLIADAMAAIGQAQSASIRGFRYGTHVPAGWGITMEDIYHYVPIAAKLGRTSKACGADLKFAIEQSTQGVFHPDPTLWAGGWMFGYSGLTMDVDACDGFTNWTSENPVFTPVGSAGNWGTYRGTNIKVAGQPIDINDAYNGATKTCNSGVAGYTVTGYWYADDPRTINNCNPCRGRLIQVVKTDGSIVNVTDESGVVQTLPASLELMDVTEAVVKYLRENLNGVVTPDNLPTHRLTVKRLPTINPYPFQMVQPLRGASAATCPPSPLP